MLGEVAERALRAREAFLAVASHELKTPLTPLSLKLRVVQGLLERGASRQELMDVLGGADQHVHRVAEFVDYLVDVSAAAADGPPPLTRARTDLGALARRVAERRRAELDAEGCSVTVCAAEVVGHWDAARLEEVVEHLLRNAKKYAPGRIDVVAEGDPAVARLSVRDRGPGIAREDQARIFLPFERAVSYRHVSGLGMGLRVVRQIVAAHGGRVRLESAPGEGSAFTVELPRAPAAA